jgi:hypothetical protein
LTGHCETLAARVWERRLWPIKKAYYDNLPPGKAEALLRYSARPYTPPPQPEGTVGVTLDLGIEIP